MARFLQVAKTPIVVIVVAAAMFYGVKLRYGSYGDYYYLTVDLPAAGQLMRVGADVRERGVVIGKVSDIALVDRHARMTLQIRSGYRIPSDAEAYVDLKTLLGDKFIDLRSAEFAPPFLRGGETIPGHVGPELEDVLQSGVDVLSALNPQDAATIVHELATAARGHGDDIGRGIEVNAELSTLFADTLEPQLKGLHAFHVIFAELRNRGIDMNNLAEAINEGVPVYASPRAQAELRRVLTALVPMSRHLGDLLILERANWDRMMDSGDVVLQTIASRPDDLHDLVHGLYQYVFKLGHPAPDVDDGTEMAPFVNFFTEDEEGGGHRSQSGERQGGETQGAELIAAIQRLCDLLPSEESADMRVCRTVNR